jgi:hypothetical protein
MSAAARYDATAGAARSLIFPLHVDVVYVHRGVA